MFSTANNVKTSLCESVRKCQKINQLLHHFAKIKLSFMQEMWLGRHIVGKNKIKRKAVMVKKAEHRTVMPSLQVYKNMT
jgi:hypothetical protein